MGEVFVKKLIRPMTTIIGRIFITIPQILVLR